MSISYSDSLSWKEHTAQLIPKLSKACYVLRCIIPFMSLEALKSVYYSYFHSLLPLQSQYILSLMMFVVENKNLFHIN